MFLNILKGLRHKELMVLTQMPLTSFYGFISITESNSSIFLNTAWMLNIGKFVSNTPGSNNNRSKSSEIG